MADPSLVQFLADNPTVVCATLTRVRGSSPRGEGTQILITANDVLGTVGGGQLEYLVIQTARAMLVERIRYRNLDVPLGPEINQCCGGHVEVTLFSPTQTERETLIADHAAHVEALPHVYVFGAGHVGRAICDLLQFMPARTLLVDARPQEQEKCTALVERSHTALPETHIRAAPAGSVAVVATHEHALDFLIASEALAHGSFAYVGMIGSKTKRATFASWLREHAPKCDPGQLICPMGKTASRDKRPAVIASFVVAEVMQTLGPPPEAIGGEAGAVDLALSGTES